MSIARLAIRNLVRNPRRTALTLVAIIAGVALSIIGRGFIEGLNESLIVAAVQETMGHVVAHPSDYPERGLQRPVDELLELNAKTKALLDREAIAWAPRTQFSPLIAHGADSMRVVAIGFDPERDPSVFPRDHWRVQGAVPAKEDRAIAISGRIAQLLDVAPGDTIVLQVRTHLGAMNALEVHVAGIVRTGNPALDTLGIWVPAALTEELIRSQAPSHLSVRLAGREASLAFAPKLAAAMGEQAKVLTWQEETADMLKVQEIRKTALHFVVFILLALAAFGIANTILMAAHERTREIGTLRSMGMTEGGVLGLFLLEGSLLGLVGGGLGALLGGVAVSYWARNPVDMSKSLEQAGTVDLSASALIYTRLEPSVLVVGVILGALVAVLASIYPAWVASRMVPADAVRAAS